MYNQDTILTEEYRNSLFNGLPTFLYTDLTPTQVKLISTGYSIIGTIKSVGDTTIYLIHNTSTNSKLTGKYGYYVELPPYYYSYDRSYRPVTDNLFDIGYCHKQSAYLSAMAAIDWYTARFRSLLQ